MITVRVSEKLWGLVVLAAFAWLAHLLGCAQRPPATAAVSKPDRRERVIPTLPWCELPPLLTGWSGFTDYTGEMPRCIYWGQDIGAHEFWLFGDLDFDADVDLDDWSLWDWCRTEPGISPPTENAGGQGVQCAMLCDRDNDGDVDLADWAQFQIGFGEIHGPPVEAED
jgi:hypothetical protein